jgi:hypothetical protein
LRAVVAFATVYRLRNILISQIAVIQLSQNILII